MKLSRLFYNLFQIYTGFLILFFLFPLYLLFSIIPTKGGQKRK